MGDCLYYEIDRQNIRSHPIGQPVLEHIMEAPYYIHDQSTVTRLQAANTVGEADLLKCGGDRSKCQPNCPANHRHFLARNVLSGYRNWVTMQLTKGDHNGWRTHGFQFE